MTFYAILWPYIIEIAHVTQFTVTGKISEYGKADSRYTAYPRIDMFPFSYFFVIRKELLIKLTKLSDKLFYK